MDSLCGQPFWNSCLFVFFRNRSGVLTIHCITKICFQLCDTHSTYTTQQETPGGKPELTEQLNKTVDPQQLDKVYTAELGPLCYDTADILVGFYCLSDVNRRSLSALITENELQMRKTCTHNEIRPANISSWVVGTEVKKQPKNRDIYLKRGTSYF